MVNNHWLVVWNMNGLWLSINIGNNEHPTDELIFFRGVDIPPTSYDCFCWIWTETLACYIVHGFAACFSSVYIDGKPNWNEYKIYHETLCHTQIGEIKHDIFADTPGSNEVLKFAWMLGSIKISVQRLFDDMIFKVHQDVNCSEENCTNPTCRSIRLCLYPMFGCVWATSTMPIHMLRLQAPWSDLKPQLCGIKKFDYRSVLTRLTDISKSNHHAIW